MVDLEEDKNEVFEERDKKSKQQNKTIEQPKSKTEESKKGWLQRQAREATWDGEANLKTPCP